MLELTERARKEYVVLEQFTFSTKVFATFHLHKLA